MQASAIGTSVAIATPDLEIIEGHVTTTSQQIAEHFGKRHADVIRAIRKLDAPADFTERNFALSEITDSTGRRLPAYRITRDGFTLLAMGFTGKEAMQWKVAYLTAFNKMEAELLAKAQPAPSSLAYDRISPAQAQDLKEIVAAIVKAGVQGFGETWNRLQRKFHVNSYLELPASKHVEARRYLIAKLPNGYVEDLVNDGPKADTLNETVANWVRQIETPNGTPALIFMPLVEAVQRKLGKPAPAIEPAAPTLRGRRWLIATDHEGRETVQPIGQDEFVNNWRNLARGIATGDTLLTNAELVDLATACNQRLIKRLGNPAIVLAV